MAKKNAWKYPVLLGSGIVLAALILSLSPLAPPVLKDYVRGAIGKRDVYRDSSATATSGGADVSGSNAEFAKIYAMGQFRSLANNSDFKALLNSADFQSVIAQQGFAQFVTNGQFQQLMAAESNATGIHSQQSHSLESQVTALATQLNLGSVAANVRFLALVQNANFQALVQNVNFQALVSNASFQSAAATQNFATSAQFAVNSSDRN